MPRVYISLGTNLGEREANIDTALRLLCREFGRPWLEISDIVNTEAVGFDGPDFLNAVVCFETALAPGQVLALCKRVEKEMGRSDAPEYNSDGRRVYHDRKIDIDILDYEGVRMRTDALTIPHARLRERPFFRRLLRQVRGK